MTLTDARCKAIKAIGKPQKLTDGGGLFLYVNPKGKKFWRIRYVYAEKENTLSFGEYPLISLSDARKKREEIKLLLKDGINPSLEKKIQQQKIIEKHDNSFEAIAREWHKKQEKNLTADYWKNKLHRLEQDIFPRIGAFPISDIKASQLLKVIQKIEERGANDIARRMLQMCGQIFRYGIITGRCEIDPSYRLSEALEAFKKGHYACIEIDELPEFLEKLSKNEARLFIPTINAIKLIMLTFVRTGELIGAKWEEIDLENKMWTIPAERMKMKRQHLVPLSKQVMEILENQRRFSVSDDGFIFPSQSRPETSHMSNNTILKALGRLGYEGRMTGHGFRALAMSSIKEKLGYRHEVVDRQLAHAPKNKIDAAYDRAKFLDERVIMMQKWADYIDSLI